MNQECSTVSISLHVMTCHFSSRNWEGAKTCFFVFSYGSDADKLYVLVLYTAIYPRRRWQAAKVSKTSESKEAKTRKLKIKICKITGKMFVEKKLKLSQRAGVTRHHPNLLQVCCRQWWCCWPGRIQNEYNQQPTMGLNQEMGE